MKVAIGYQIQQGRYNKAPGAAEDMASAVVSLCAHPERKATIGVAARSVVESELKTRRMAERLRVHMDAVIGRSIFTGA